ncbi:type IV toxin-antitoxin system AbiEi family antitoxin domain-containing protein [Paucilactobacillus sp. N302-9]
MHQTEIVMNFVKKNKGQITNDDAQKLGVPKMLLYRMADQHQLEKLAPGVFIDPTEFGDDLAALQYRFSKGVFFKDTALFLHGMIDKTPEIYEMNFPMSNPHQLTDDTPLKTYRQTNRLYEIGIEKIKSPGGHTLRTYNIERTLCDILRKRDRTDAETIKQAMTFYAQHVRKDILKLTEYAEIFKVRDEIQLYMEVLL